MESGMRTRFTFDPADDRSPLWSPDDSQIVFTTRGGQGGVYVRPTSGQGEPRRLFPAGAETRLTDWSSDGSLVFFSRLDTVQGYDVWTFNMATSETESVIAGESNYFDASLSPDGRWLAYVSDESDKFEVYVQSFPEAKGRWMVSSDAGQRATARPRWRSDGRELFYLRGGEVMAVPIAADDNFSFGTPKNLFSVSMMSSSADYGIGDNGQRILTNEFPPTGPGKVGARLIQNWTAALQR